MADANYTTDDNVIPFPRLQKRKRGFWYDYSAGHPRDLGAIYLPDHPGYVESRIRPTPREYSPSGQLLPPLGLARIRLSRHHATKAWRAAGDALEEATTDLQSAIDLEGDVDAALDEWRAAALSVASTDRSDPRRLRQKLALISYGCGIAFQHGGIRGGYKSRAEIAMEMVDRIVLHIDHRRETAPNAG